MKKKLALILAVMMIASVSLVAAVAADVKLPAFTWTNSSSGQHGGWDAKALDAATVAALKSAKTIVFTVQKDIVGGFQLISNNKTSGWKGETVKETAVSGKTITITVADYPDFKAFLGNLDAEIANETDGYAQFGLGYWGSGSDKIDTLGTITAVIGGSSGGGTTDAGTGTSNAKTGDSSIAFIALAILLMAGAGAFAFSRVAKKD
ncbi:hypothetical protein FACS1894217_15320 [Clostridia bacterium]|nr:hypothetical protein FACS1894217_15320 [Clostridia bacterium]